MSKSFPAMLQVTQTRSFIVQVKVLGENSEWLDAKSIRHRIAEVLSNNGLSISPDGGTADGLLECRINALGNSSNEEPGNTLYIMIMPLLKGLPGTADLVIIWQDIWVGMADVLDSGQDVEDKAAASAQVLVNQIKTGESDRERLQHGHQVASQS